MQMKDKICIIDDDPDIVEIYSIKLKNEGFEIISAPNGEIGLDKVRAEKPDLILLDILMPKKNGAEVLRELKNDPAVSKIPVIVLSNVSDDKTIEKIGSFSTHFYAIKSLTTPEKISGMVKEVLYGQS